MVRLSDEFILAKFAVFRDLGFQKQSGWVKVQDEVRTPGLCTVEIPKQRRGGSYLTESIRLSISVESTKPTMRSEVPPDASMRITVG